MNGPVSQRGGWFARVSLLGLVYFAIGRLFTWTALNIVAWRWLAWVLSGAVFAAHLRFELQTRRIPPRSAARLVATGVAIGGFLLAAAAGLTSAMAGTFRPTWLLALIAWPAVVAIPAWIVALIAGWLAERIRPTGARGD